MQKPLNAKEHNQAFLKFLFFLSLTIAMIAGALFINFEVPNHELEILRERSDNYRNHMIAQENFKKTLNEFMAVANRSDSSSKAMIESEARPKLDALRNAIAIEDSTSGTRMNMSIIALANQYLNARSKLADLRGFDDEIRRLKDKIAELQYDLENCRSRVNFGNQ
jgi:hypothetical protein